ncbi:hypothetical protein GGS24DRAFT_499143 [Hypoxylon argillaceum]|nr:hypothetical protein GGS24DRAFT_499143 [Hypoxylon argillaceum]
MEHVDGYVIETDDNCVECKACQKAEEECQRNIYRSRPLCLHVKDKGRMSALLASYRQDLQMRKKVRSEQLVREAEIRQNNGKKVEEEDLVVAPMLITARHQYNTSYISSL